MVGLVGDTLGVVCGIGNGAVLVLWCDGGNS